MYPVEVGGEELNVVQSLGDWVERFAPGMTAPQTGSATARSGVSAVLPAATVVVTVAVILGAAVLAVARFGWPAMDTTDVVLSAGLLLEFAFVLAVAPRLTRRLVKRDAQEIFDRHMRPGVREEVARLRDDLRVPAPAELAASVRDALLEAQAKAMAGKPDPMVALREAMREELDAAMEKLAAADEAMGVEEAAQVMSRRGVDARMTFAAQEEQFQAAVLKAAGQNGPLAVAALEQAKATFPATYKVMVRQGPAAVPAFFKQAGLKPMVGGEPAGGGGGWL